jgi:hypothetical protein
MPDLMTMLQGNDLSFLRQVANSWKIDLTAPDAYTALPILVDKILNPQLIAEVIEALPMEAQAALQDLLENENRISWALFCRRHGELRVIGAAKRDRERPDLKPISPTEILWYRALIGKDFFDLSDGNQEYAYIPDDLIENFTLQKMQKKEFLGRPASPQENAQVMPSDDSILDHACTLLSALRAGVKVEMLETGWWKIRLPILKDLLMALSLIDEEGLPNPEAVRSFLGMDRASALNFLVKGWMISEEFNELRLLPGLKIEGTWQNDPLHARQSILEMLSELPQDIWWSLTSFVAAVKENQPDFQRPAGDYDSWFILDEKTGEYLRGIGSWNEVDGALIRFMLTGPLHWLGFYDLAGPTGSTQAAAFRPTKWAESLWHGFSPKGFPAENSRIKVTVDGRLTLPPLTPRSIRYQVARFCTWEEQSAKGYHYRLTPASLERAGKVGLKVMHLTGILRKYAVSPIPPNIFRALEHWEKFSAQIHLEKATLLKVASPEIITSLRKTSATRFLGEILNPTTITIKPGGEETVRQALVEIGYLSDPSL